MSYLWSSFQTTMTESPFSTVETLTRPLLTKPSMLLESCSLKTCQKSFLNSYSVLTKVTIGNYVVGLVRNNNCTNFAQDLLNRL